MAWHIHVCGTEVQKDCDCPEVKEAAERGSMSTVFTRATQALAADKGRGVMWGLLLAADLLGAWGPGSAWLP